MAQTHFIKRLKFDSKLEDGLDQQEFYLRLKILLDRKLNKILDEVLEAYAPASHHLIDRIELDLKHINWDKFEEEFPAKLENELREQLSRLIPTAVQNQAPRLSQKKGKKWPELRAILAFLQKGYFPWWVPKETWLEKSQVYEKLIQKKDSQTNSIIKQLRNSRSSQKRLVYQFEELSTLLTIRELEPENALFIEDYAADLLESHRIQPIVSTGFKEFKRVRWEIILNFLLAERGSFFNDKVFVKSTLTQLASRYNSTYTKVLDFLAVKLNDIAPHLKYRSNFSGILNFLVQDEWKSSMGNTLPPGLKVSRPAFHQLMEELNAGKKISDFNLFLGLLADTQLEHLWREHFNKTAFKQALSLIHISSQWNKLIKLLASKGISAQLDWYDEIVELSRLIGLTNSPIDKQKLRQAFLNQEFGKYKNTFFARVLFDVGEATGKLEILREAYIHQTFDFSSEGLSLSDSRETSKALSQLEGFIKDGSLTERDKRGSLRQILKAIPENQKDNARSLLRTYLMFPSFRARLSAQLKDVDFRFLIQFLQPLKLNYIDKLSEEIRIIQREQKIWAIETSSFENQLRNSLLTAVVKHKGAFDKKRFGINLLLGMRIERVKDPKSWIRSFSNKLNTIQEAQREKLPLLSEFLDKQPEENLEEIFFTLKEAKRSKGTPLTDEQLKALPLVQLRRFLELGPISEKLYDFTIVSLLQNLKKNDSLKAKEILFSWGKETKSHDFLIEALSEPDFKLLLELLNPAKADFLTKLSKEIHDFYLRYDIMAIGERDFFKIRWSSFLHLLLSKGPSRLKEEEFVLEVLKGMAEKAKLKIEDWLNFFFRVFQKRKVHTSEFQALSQGMSVLQNQYSAKSPDKKPIDILILLVKEGSFGQRLYGQTLEEILPTLSGEERKLFLRALKQLVKSPSQFKKLLEVLDQASVFTLISWLDVDSTNDLEEIFSVLSIAYQRVPFGNVSSSKFQTQLLGLILSFMLDRKSGAIRKNELLVFLTKEFSALWRMKASRLQSLLSWSLSISDASKADKWHLGLNRDKDYSEYLKMLVQLLIKADPLIHITSSRLDFWFESLEKSELEELRREIKEELSRSGQWLNISASMSKEQVFQLYDAFLPAFQNQSKLFFNALNQTSIAKKLGISSRSFSLQLTSAYLAFYLEKASGAPDFLDFYDFLAEYFSGIWKQEVIFFQSLFQLALHDSMQVGIESLIEKLPHKISISDITNLSILPSHIPNPAQASAELSMLSILAREGQGKLLAKLLLSDGSEDGFVKLLRKLSIGQDAFLLQFIELADHRTTWQAIIPGEKTNLRLIFKEITLQYLIERPSSVFSLRQFLRYQIERLSQSLGLDIRTLLETLLKLSQKKLPQGTLSILLQELKDSQDFQKEIPPNTLSPSTNALAHTQNIRIMEDNNELIGESLYINNAGLVLLTPYIKLLFERLGLLENNEFTSKEASEKAVGVLQFLVSGELITEEHELTLNKLLCNLPITTPIPRELDLNNYEKEIAEGLLSAVNKAWPPLSNSSISALRETFLQREGMILFEEEKTLIRVQRKGGVDALLESLPWGISIINFPWRDELLYVEW
ncbi:MAG: contractile injection system tape measure protein [Bacteroidia bacterium]|nr:contractile injection system tape measure protein [Bacteroidia bacterium]